MDRRFDKNADSGRFELAYKQSPVTVPPYIGLNLSVDGQGIKPPPPVKSTESSCSRLHESASQEERVDTDKVGKASEKDEAKSDEEGGETSDMSEQKTSNPPSKSSSATRDMTKRKSQSSPLKTASKMSQESVQSAQKSAGTTKSEATWKKERSVSQSVISQTNGVSKSMASPTSMYAITGSRRIVSRTSVANNYPVVNTNQGQKEQQTLQVNTVDSKTLQSQSSTSAPNKGNLDKQYMPIGKQNSFPLPPKIRRLRPSKKQTHQPQRPEVMIKLPSLPYADMNIEYKGGGTRLKYFNQRPAVNPYVFSPGSLGPPSNRGVWVNPYV